MDMSVAEKIARRFAALPAAQRKAVYDKMRSQGMSLAQLPILPCQREPGQPLPLSYAQQRQWFLWQLEPQSTAYHLCGGLALEGELDADALVHAFDTLVARHESLRTVLRADAEGLAEQVILPEQRVAVDRVDLRHVPIEEQEARAQDAARALTDQPFDLTKGPLLRVGLIQLDERSHRLVVVMHHIVSDGWSMQVIVDEFAACYRALRQGQTPQLPPLAIQYADYAQWQRHWLEAGERERQLAYWRAQLSGGIGGPGDDSSEHPVLALPTDRPRQPHGRLRGARHTMQLPMALAEQVRRSAQAQGATVFMLLLTAFHALLHRHSGQRDIRVGVPVANRQRIETEAVVGFFVNTQVLRSRIAPRMTLQALLEQVREAVLGAQAHQDLPFEQLVEALQPERSLGHHPLFQVMANHLRQDRRALQDLPGLQLKDWTLGDQAAQFELTLDTIELPDGRIEATFTYAAELFEAQTIARLARHHQRLLAALCEAPQQAIGDVDLLGDDEQALLRRWSGWQAAIDEGQGTHAAGGTTADITPVHRLIEEQVRRTPEAIALIHDDAQLSYAELNRRANCLAHRLIALGAGPEVRIGLALERSLEMVVALLAVLKSGAAYVPLDPDYPAERLGWMIEDSGLAMVLTQSRLKQRLAEGTDLALPLLCIDEPEHASATWPDHNPQIPSHGEHLAYVIYTSGSTGRPKGAANRHNALHNRLTWMQKAYQLGPEDTVLQKTPFGFDVSVWEFFWPLMTGARLAMASPGDHKDPGRLLALIQRHGITTLHFVPSMLQAFVHHEGVQACTGLRRIICSGEALPPELQSQALQRWPVVALHNLYGPTEAAIDVTHWPCREDGRGIVPIGHPIDRVHVHVLGDDLQLTPPGVPGELYLGGAGLGRGYLGRPGLTAERFIADPFDPLGGRLYRTGDLVRWRADGELEYLGRLDHQVKIRGLRIELGEIESRFLAQPGIREAVVVAQPARTGARLVAYVVSEDAARPFEQAALRDTLSRHLPEYMVPSAIVRLDALPLNANGKLDRKALPAPDAAPEKNWEAPEGEIETALAAVWAEVLELPRVGRHDNFFELGGDSILSLQIVARCIRKGWRLAPKHLFECQTVALLANVAEPVDAGAAVPRADAGLDEPAKLSDHIDAALMALIKFGDDDIEDAYPLSPTQEGMLFHTLESPGSGLYVNQLSVEVEGADAERFVQAWQTVVRRHAVLKTGFIWQAGMQRPIQFVRKDVEPQATLLDWRGEADQPARVARFAEDDLRRGFDLQAPPLSRLSLIRLDEHRHHLVLTQHHLLLDGWSDSRVVGDWLRCYGGEALPDSGPSYGRYIRWLARQDSAATEAFWRHELTALDGPTLLAQAVHQSHGTQSARTDGYGKLYTRLDQASTRALQDFARAERITFNTLIQGAWALVLQRCTGKDHAVFGATVAGRPTQLPQADDILGLFINTLPVPVSRMPSRKVGDYLRALQATNLRLREHEHSALADVQRWAGSSGRPLFDSIIVFENYPVDQALRGNERHGLRFGEVASQGLTGYAMDLQVVVGDRLEIEYCYARADFPDDFVIALRTHVEHLLMEMAQQPMRSVGELPWLRPSERDALLAWGRNDVASRSRPAFVHRQIEQHAACRPDAVAVCMGDEALTYGELNRRANRLAHALRSEGIGPEARVGVAMSRTPAAFVALLAVLKAGAAYVPLDAAYPAERLAYMMTDSGVRFVLTEPDLRERLPWPAGVQAWLVSDGPDVAGADRDPDVPLGEHALAYVIYTSGSTGQPKGVAVTHGPLAMHCEATAGIYGMTKESCELLFMSLSFDGAHERWLTTLTVGARLALRGNELWTAEQTLDALQRHGVTNAAFPPAYLGHVAEAAAARGEAPPVGLYVFGGEAMPKASYDKVRRALKPRTLINGYGPTETVVTPLIWKTAATETFDCAYAPIGRPVGDRTLYVLDVDMQPVPRGVPGELYIGGYGLARGYLGRPGLSAERFIADPFGEDGGRLYRTGDLVRWLEDGNIEYLGRLDHQVKIRGFRIELGEIEACIRDLGVKDVAVVVSDAPAGRQLLAYVVQDAAEGRGVQALQRQLADRLPAHMVPAHVVALPSLPRLPSGKLDRAALPAAGEQAIGRAHVPPASPASRTLASIWEEVLKVERVSETDNFFELGGDSLLSLKAVSKMRQSGLPQLAGIKLRDLMQRPTIAGLLYLQGQGAEGGKPVHQPLLLNRPCPDAAPLYCVHAGVGTIFDYQPLARRLDGVRPVYGIACRSLADPSHMDASIEQMAVDYVAMMRAQQPQGPYHLLGWSLGGTLAAMMAALQEREGQEVAFLGLVDPYVPEAEVGYTVSDWRGDLAEFLAEVWPSAQPAAMDALPVKEPDAAWLSRCLTVLGGDMPASALGAAMTAEDLARMFAVTRHLKSLSREAGALPAVKVAAHVWWIASRPALARQLLAEQVKGAYASERDVDSTHLGVLHASGFVDELMRVLAVSDAPCLSA